MRKEQGLVRDNAERRKVQAEERTGIDREPGSARNLKLIPRGGTRDQFRREDPEAKSTVLVVYCHPKNTNYFGAGGCLIVIICPAPASLISKVCISQKVQTKHSSGAKCNYLWYICSASAREAGEWEKGEENFPGRKVESWEHLCISNPVDFLYLNRHLAVPSKMMLHGLSNCSNQNVDGIAFAQDRFPRPQNSVS